MADQLKISGDINEVYASLDFTHFYTNSTEDSLALTIQLPLFKKLHLVKCSVSFSDDVSSPPQYINLPEISLSEEYIYKTFNFPAIQAQSIVKLEYTYAQLNSSEDMSYRVFIPNILSIINNQPISKMSGEIVLSSTSQITRFVSKNPNDKLEFSYNNEYTESTLKIEKEINEDDRNEVFSVLLFRTEKMSIPQMFYQYDPTTNETAYVVHYMFSTQKIESPNEPDINCIINYYNYYQKYVFHQCPGLFVFVIDQSGSMTGSRIDTVKEMLKLFLQSLPEKSYLQILGFDNDTIIHQKTPYEFTRDNMDNSNSVINKTLQIIEQLNTGGGTSESPARYIYENLQSYKQYNLSKHLIILTDGGLFHPDICYEHIFKISNEFQVHTIGIGSDFTNSENAQMIKIAGSIGKGGYHYATEVSKLQNIIIDIMSMCLRNYILSADFKVKKVNFQMCYQSKSKIIYEDEVINFCFIVKGKPVKDLAVEMLRRLIGHEKDEQAHIKTDKNSKMNDGNFLLILINIYSPDNYNGNNVNKYKIMYSKSKLQIIIKIKVKYIWEEKKKFEEEEVQERKEVLQKNTDLIIKPNEKKKEDENENYIKSDEDLRRLYSFVSSDVLIAPRSENVDDAFMQSLLKSQDFEGFWDENEYTVKIKGFTTNNIYQQALDFVNKNYRRKNVEKDNDVIIKKRRLVMTFTTLFYILKENPMEKLIVWRLIINKAKKYLGKSFPDFLSEQTRKTVIEGNVFIDYYNPYKLLKSHKSDVNSLLLLPDGKFLSCSDDRSICLYNPDNDYEKELTIQKAHDKGVISMCLLDNNIIASSSADSTIKVWEISGNSYNCLDILKRHVGPVYKVVILSNERFVSCGEDSKINIMSSKAPYKLLHTNRDNIELIYSLLFMSNKNYLVSATNSTLGVFDAKTYKKIEIMKNVYCCGWNNLMQYESNSVIVAGVFGIVRIVDITRFVVENEFTIDENECISSILMLKDQNLIFGGYEAFYAYEKNKKKVVKRENCHNDVIWDLITLSKGEIVSCSKDGSIQIWIE